MLSFYLIFGLNRNIVGSWNQACFTTFEVWKLPSVCRIVFSAHTHEFCDYTHSDGTREVTVSAISWKATDDPGFVVATFHGNDSGVSISYCSLARESHLLVAYTSLLVMLLLMIFVAHTTMSPRWWSASASFSSHVVHHNFVDICCTNDDIFAFTKKLTCISRKLSLGWSLLFNVHQFVLEIKSCSL